MITRIWRTNFDPRRLTELRQFADTISAPMFESLPGCVGQVHANDGHTWITQTFWESHDHIAQAEASTTYRDTVRAILATGFLRGDQATELFTVTKATPPSL
jgi:heme-degrading monooxygenase HmoA